MAKLLQVFLDSDLRLGHPGLARLANKNGIKVGELGVGEYVMFVNVKKNKLKLYAANEIVAYLRLPKGSIDVRTLALIPKTFESRGRLDYDGDLRTVIEREFLYKQTKVRR